MSNLSLLRFSTLLVWACLPLFATAQGERWYQVELLIFSNEDTVTNEQWEPLPKLAYPDAARFLISPAVNEARIEEQETEARALTAVSDELEFGVESETDEFGRLFIRILDITPEDTPDIPLPEPAEELADPVEQSVPLLPTPFIALARSSREFHGKAAYMRRTGFYRILFHETWVQPVRDEQRALPLIIDRSGDNQTWPRLQGSVRLHLSRYLHIETNLWLNTAGEYLPGEWQMPEPPLGPVSVIVEAPEPEAEEVPYYVDPVPAAPLSTEPVDGEELQEPEGPVYPWRHAVRLNQKRKMRSNEVHYIDHPLFGVVVKLTPLDEEQLQILAEQEAGDSSGNSPVKNADG